MVWRHHPLRPVLVELRAQRAVLRPRSRHSNPPRDRNRTVHPEDKFWVGVALALVVLPLLVPWNMIPSLWLGLLNPETGLLGRIMANFGWSSDWKLSAVQTWAVILAMDTWHWTSLVVLLCYSAFTAIPSSYYQAAEIDGAGPWQVFRHIQ